MRIQPAVQALRPFSGKPGCQEKEGHGRQSGQHNPHDGQRQEEQSQKQSDKARHQRTTQVKKGQEKTRKLGMDSGLAKTLAGTNQDPAFSHITRTLPYQMQFAPLHPTDMISHGTAVAPRRRVLGILPPGQATQNLEKKTATGPCIPCRRKKALGGFG